MGSIIEEDQTTNANGSGTVKFSFDTNWIIAHGSFHDSITVESSDSPIDDPTPNSPLLLNPHGTHSDPCQINIYFERKYEVGLVYVRSSARIYEVYYARSPQGSSEYLCTVRCGVAERDDKVLTTASVEDVSSENGRCSVGEVAGNVATDGETTVSSDDEWVKIKIPGAEKNSLSDCTSINRVTNVQDLYEATAQINDAEACSCLTIRLLSLQDKSHVHVDEVYVFVDPVESTEAENVGPAQSLTQSPLMAMLMPTLMQLSASGTNRSTQKLELQKGDNVESSLERPGEVDCESEKGRVDTQYSNLNDLGKNIIDSHEIQQPSLNINSGKASESSYKNDHTHLKLKELDKDTAELDEIEQPVLDVNSTNGGETTYMKDLLPGRLERSLELLLSRVRTVEDICLRFEEKMLKPIGRMEEKLQQVEHQLEIRLQQVEHKLETRLQQVELQMEKLSENIENSCLRRGTRITAPVFSQSESNSSSFYNENHDYAINGAPGIERKNLSCNDSLDSSTYADIRPGHVDPSPCAHIRPGLVVTAPEFSCGEDEDNNGELESLKDVRPGPKPKPTPSVDDALAAALSGLLSTAKSHQPENEGTAFGVLTEEKENKHMGLVEVHQDIIPELPAAANCSRESVNNTGILSIKAPEFIEEEIGTDESNQNSLPTVPIITSVVKHEEDKVPLSTCCQNLFTPNMYDLHANDGKIQEKDHGEDKVPLTSHSGSLFTSADLSDLFVNYDNDDEDNDASKFAPITGSVSLLTDELEAQSDHSFDSGHLDSICTNLSESSRLSTLDFEFPILEVKFTCDEQASIRNPLESLLEGGEELNDVQGPVYDCSVYGDLDDWSAEDVITGDLNGTTDPYSSNSLLVDIGCSPDLECALHDASSTGGPEMTVSLI